MGINITREIILQVLPEGLGRFLTIFNEREDKITRGYIQEKEIASKTGYFREVFSR